MSITTNLTSLKGVRYFTEQKYLQNGWQVVSGKSWFVFCIYL